jgi:light-regulated signal transduction histidine kinase (bacteriophytochrome)
VVGIRSTLLDITERLLAEERIRRLNAELDKRVAERTAKLKRSNEDLQQFTYAVSHDLQEPLRNIVSYAELLARQFKGKLGTDGDDFLDYIIKGGQRMTALIRSLLSYSRVVNTEAGVLKPVQMQAAVEWAITNLQLAIDSSRATIRYGDLPTVRGDQVELVQLFQNLLGNAIKYRSQVPLEIVISAEEKGPDWLFSVRDNGIGIAPEYHERIFVIFKRLHGQTIPGTGVGLAICRRVVEKHGGRLWVTSEPGKGSTFFFTLPRMRNH